jgi:hypothetical protein
MDVKVESQSVEVIASGTVIAYAGEPIKISFGPSADRMNIIIVFKDEAAKVSESGVKANIIDSNTLQLTFLNVNAQMGYGSTKPFSIGTIENKRVYMQYRIYDIGIGCDKMFHYSFYRSKE